MNFAKFQEKLNKICYLRKYWSLFTISFHFLGEIHWEENKNWMDEFVDQTVILNSLQASTLLGFTPKIFGLMDNLEMYYDTYRAALGFTARSAK
jgi:hypothetical protein